MRVEQCRARNLEHGCVDVPQRKAVAKREHSTATTPDRCWPRQACRAARRRAQPTCRTAQVCRAISALSG
jgi:hypothetical protein